MRDKAAAFERLSGPAIDVETDLGSDPRAVDGEPPGKPASRRLVLK